MIGNWFEQIWKFVQHTGRQSDNEDFFDKLFSVQWVFFYYSKYSGNFLITFSFTAWLPFRFSGGNIAIIIEAVITNRHWVISWVFRFYPGWL